MNNRFTPTRNDIPWRGEQAETPAAAWIRCKRHTQHNGLKRYKGREYRQNDQWKVYPLELRRSSAAWRRSWITASSTAVRRIEATLSARGADLKAANATVDCTFANSAALAAEHKQQHKQKGHARPSRQRNCHRVTAGTDQLPVKLEPLQPVACFPPQPLRCCLQLKCPRRWLTLGGPHHISHTCYHPARSRRCTPVPKRGRVLHTERNGRPKLWHAEPTKCQELITKRKGRNHIDEV